MNDTEIMREVAALNADVKKRFPTGWAFITYNLDNWCAGFYDDNIKGSLFLAETPNDALKKARHGFDNSEPMTEEKLAAILGVSLPQAAE